MRRRIITEEVEKELAYPPVKTIGKTRCDAKNKDTNSRIRFSHNAPNHGILDVYIGERLVVEGLKYAAVTDYIMVPPNDYDLSIGYTGNSERNKLLANSCHLDADVDYIYIIHEVSCGERGLTATLVPSDTKCIDNDKAYLKVFNALIGIPAIDIYLDNSYKIFAAVSQGNLSNPKYMSMPGGFKSLSITESGKLAIMYGPMTVNLEPRQIYTLVLSGDTVKPITPVVIEDTNELTINYFPTDSDFSREKIRYTKI